MLIYTSLYIEQFMHSAQGGVTKAVYKIHSLSYFIDLSLQQKKNNNIKLLIL